MAEMMRQTEMLHEGYPAAPTGLSAKASALDANAIWQRMESYIAWRFSVRTVEWIVEGRGAWSPPLGPATITSTEVWQNDAWATVVLTPSPLGGFVLPCCAPYRIIGTVGEEDAEVPAIVQEAWRRLAEYLGSVVVKPGIRTESVPNVWQGEYDNRAVAKALQDSGAADLLRSYRRA